MDEDQEPPQDVEGFAAWLLDQVCSLHPRYQTGAADAKSFVEQIAEDKFACPSLRIAARAFLKQMKAPKQEIYARWSSMPTSYGGSWKSSLDF